MVASGAPFQLVTTFNEWGEGTSVESATEWNSLSGYGAYLDALHNNGGAQSLPTIAPTVVPATVTAQPTLTATKAATSTALPLPSATSISSSATLSFTSEADAQVVEANPTTNYGNFTTLQVDGGTDPDVDSYLRFTVSGVSGPIQSAKLRVFDTTNASINGPAVYGVSNTTWSETGITWNTRPARTTGAIDNKGKIDLQTWVEYNVSARVTGNGTYSFVLGADSTDAATFSSRQGATPPQLVVTFGGQAATSIPTSTLVQIASPTSAPSPSTATAPSPPRPRPRTWAPASGR